LKLSLSGKFKVAPEAPTTTTQNPVKTVPFKPAKPSKKPNVVQIKHKPKRI